MGGMELHSEVIRDKETIYEQLLQSKSLDYQLAICYRTDDHLIVKICHVDDVSQGNDGVQVTLRTKSADETVPGETEAVISLDKIESIYPIHAFRKS